MDDPGCAGGKPLLRSLEVHGRLLSCCCALARGPGVGSGVAASARSARPRLGAPLRKGKLLPGEGWSGENQLGKTLRRLQRWAPGARGYSWCLERCFGMAPRGPFRLPHRLGSGVLTAGISQPGGRFGGIGSRQPGLQLSPKSEVPRDWPPWQNARKVLPADRP